MDDERVRLIREVRQRLESLRRAGVDRLPAPKTTRVARPAAPALAETPEPVAAKVSAKPYVPPPPDLARSSLLFPDSELEEPPVAAADRPAALAKLATEVSVCTRCPALAAARTQTVFGEGSPTSRLMFVGEAPGHEEDRTGRPFVGRAGSLLTDMITKGMGLERENVYIANVLKSRPPENRTPLPDEMAHCLPYLEQQIRIIRPELLCLLGKTAVVALLKSDLSMGRLRQKWHLYRGIPTIVTYHPAYLLRNPAAKKDTWEDLQMLMAAMGLEPPARKSNG